MDGRLKVALAIFAVIALLFLWGEHKVHLPGALPWLILLACPLIHLFMHGRHGGHGNNEGGQRND